MKLYFSNIKLRAPSNYLEMQHSIGNFPASREDGVHSLEPDVWEISRGLLIIKGKILVLSIDDFAFTKKKSVLDAYQSIKSERRGK